MGTLIPALLPLPPRHLPKPRAPKPTTTSSLHLGRRGHLAVVCASSGGDGGPSVEGEKCQGPSLPALSEIRWGELLTLEPANAAAVLLTEALDWAGASLQNLRRHLRRLQVLPRRRVPPLRPHRAPITFSLD